MRARTNTARLTWCAVAVLLSRAAGCVDTVTEPEEQFVVQAFLYAGEPVTDVRVTKTRALSSEDTTVAPINDAEIRLTKRGVRYRLTPTGEDGYYHYAGTDLTVDVGDIFSLEVANDGKTATAETTVPPRPVNVTASKTTVLAPDFTTPQFGGSGGAQDTSTQLAVTWANVDQELYFVVVKSIEDNPKSLLPDQIGGQPFGRSRLVSQPDSDDVHIVDSRQLQYYGRHQVKVYRINEEYAQLYENRTQDSRDLNEPPTNIRNGLGVFSAFSSGTVFFSVVER
jgi:hypothetical protein